MVSKPHLDICGNAECLSGGFFIPTDNLAGRIFAFSQKYGNTVSVSVFDGVYESFPVQIKK